MVANCRVKTATSFGLIRSVKPGDDDLGLEPRAGGRRDRHGQVAHLAQAAHDQRQAVAVELALDQVARPVADLVVERQCHLQSLLLARRPRSADFTAGDMLPPVQVVAEVFFVPAPVEGHALGDHAAA